MVISHVTIEMFERYKKEGKQGNAESAFRVYTCSSDPATNMPQDKDVAREFLDIAVNNGSVDGKFSKGAHLYVGDLYTKDINLGLQMMQDARDEGCLLADSLAKQLGIDLGDKSSKAKEEDDIFQRAQKYAYQSTIEKNQFSDDFRKNNPHIAALHGMSNILKGKKPYENVSTSKVSRLNKTHKNIILSSFFLLAIALYYFIPSITYLLSIGAITLFMVNTLLLALINNKVPAKNPYSGLDDYNKFSYDAHAKFWPFCSLFGLVLCLSILLIFPKIYYSEVLIYYSEILLIIFPLTFLINMTPYLIYEIKNLYLVTKQLNFSSKSHFSYGISKRERNLSFAKLAFWFGIIIGIYFFLSYMNIFENLSSIIFTPSFFKNLLVSIVNIILIPLGYALLYLTIPQIYYAFFHDGKDDRWIILTSSKIFFGW